ncbi:hypothetical protein HDV05_008192 [Chytridiales sp. JEL 0842]|nr:hypothetical protein HDV05_008192 [Chytridiales sp. JEL 0842]
MGTFLLAIVVQGYYKFSLIASHYALKKKQSKKKDADGKPKTTKVVGKLDRYNHPSMIVADRVVGNFLEWQMAFLVPFWLNAALRGGQDIWVGWIFVASRVIYPFLAVWGKGVTAAGPQPVILLTTVPGYFVMMYYSYQIFMAVV